MKISQQLKQQLEVEEDIPEIENFFWTDSEVVLNYINNESKRFKVFVANHVQMIRNYVNLSLIWMGFLGLRFERGRGRV